ncbi:hypothetical protein GF377_03810, partial [candidate division GN15 bacterium]|nr:hypothetical protein [candidate division GN15 bacterium]
MKTRQDMNGESLVIREARPDELPGIHGVLSAAFGAEEAPRIIRMVDEM